jgi:tight adherence protein B
MAMQQLALAILVSLAVGGVAWVFLYPLLAGQDQITKRKGALTKASDRGPRIEDTQRSGKKRRDQVEESLRELEARQRKNARPSLSVRLQRAGLKWTKQQFIMISAGIGVFLLVASYVLMGNPLAALLLGFAGGFGVPFWLLAFLRKRREKQFLNVFPDAVDVIVRGVKSGLPLLDCIKMISAEAAEPVRSEFRTILERQAIGTPIGEACGTMFERIALPEANFCGIVIQIQSKAGGNLSEALGNLSRVLRDRKKMRGKIQAMSMEAKASAGIIGALPLIVMFLVYISTPDYITILFTDEVGRILLLISAFWMSCGVFVMKKMINFDF